MTEQNKNAEVKMRPQEKAVKDIYRALKNAGAEYDKDELQRHVQVLYLAWENSQIEPTCTRLANLIHDNDAAIEVIKNMERDPFVDDGRDKKRVIGIICGAAAVIVLVVLGATAAFGFPTQAAPEPSPTPSATQVQEAEATYPVTVVINAEGADKALTPAKFEILDTAGAVVIAETEAAANTETQIEELKAGSYSLRMTAAPVLKDGSTYTLPKEATAFDVAESDTPVTVAVTLKKLDADDMTKEQLEAAANEVKQSGNASAATAISDKASHAQSKPGSDAAVSAEPTPAPSKPSSGGNSGGNSSKPSGGSSSTEPSKPAHVHNWVEQTEKKWVVDEQPWIEEIAVGSVFHCKCGLDFNSSAAVGEHLESSALAGDLNHSYWVETIYEEIHHEEQGHYETVVTGYKCSSCGATK